MSELECICEMNSVEESKQFTQDVLAGRGLDVLFCLMDGSITVTEISQKLKMPSYSIHLYLQRFIKIGLVKEISDCIVNGVVEKKYCLVSNEIEIINRIQSGQLSEAAKKRHSEITAQHFSIMTRNAIKQALSEPDKPNKVKAYFMKTQKENMQEFRKEIDNLFTKYQSLENLSEKETYSLFTVLAPYTMEE